MLQTILRFSWFFEWAVVSGAVTYARRLLFCANTPKNRVKLSFGGGISATSLPTKSMG
jgi:hypothetical protein